MQQIEPQSPFLKPISEAEENFLSKKLTSMLQTDKENIIKENPQLRINKMSIGENQMDIFIVELPQMLKLKRENTKDLIRGLVKQNDKKPVVIGIYGEKQLKNTQTTKNFSGMAQNLLKSQVKSFFNLNILIKLKSEQSPYISMFSCNCLSSVLEMYLMKNISDFKKQDLKIKWKYDFYVKDEKIGQIMILNETKGDQVFVNIGVRLKLDSITNKHESFTRDLLQQFACRLNISKNLRQTAAKIHQNYQSSLMFIGQQVFVKRRQPNQWQETLSGKFIKVNQIGYAILQNEQGQQDQIQDGYMQKRGNSQDFKDQQKIEKQKMQVIEM